MMSGLGFDYAALAADLRIPCRSEVRLADYTTMKVGGPAAWWFEPETARAAAQLYSELFAGPLPVRVLGAGSNLVVSDEGVRAAVIHTGRMHAEPTRVSETEVLVLAGVPVPGLARWAARAGLSGLEFAEGIPAQLGGAIRMNAGANGAWFGEIARSVMVAGPAGLVHQHSVHPDDFGYRDSFVARQQLIALAATLELRRDEPEAIRRRLTEYKTRRRASQPLQDRSAGCAFTNWPDLPVGRLVEQLGLKGLSVGDAEVSPLHGNFIVNRGQARAADVLALIDRVRNELTRATGREPRIEIEIWRDQP
jgi:UDP-N-acetylmuramate dehydrogenase